MSSTFIGDTIIITDINGHAHCKHMCQSVVYASGFGLIHSQPNTVQAIPYQGGNVDKMIVDLVNLMAYA